MKFLIALVVTWPIFLLSGGWAWLKKGIMEAGEKGDVLCNDYEDENDGH